MPTRCGWLAAIHSQGEQPYPPDLGATTGPAPTSHQPAEHLGGYRGAHHHRAVTVGNKARRRSGNQVPTVQSRQLAPCPSRPQQPLRRHHRQTSPSDQRDQEACLGLVTRCKPAPSPPTLMQKLYELRRSPVKRGLKTRLLVSAVHGGSRGYRLCHVHPNALHQVSTVTGVL